MSRSGRCRGGGTRKKEEGTGMTRKFLPSRHYLEKKSTKNFQTKKKKDLTRGGAQVTKDSKNAGVGKERGSTQ